MEIVSRAQPFLQTGNERTLEEPIEEVDVDDPEELGQNGGRQEH
jgi:hypothetical protein